ncbi:MAG: HEAT repeat domain-containing protein [Phycisphaerae bacterium]|nr:HEAT repeat domain-containing protein [Phycisphaerae bacterium]
MGRERGHAEGIFSPTWDGVGGGFAHSPAYIDRVNRLPFEGQKPEEIARYPGHFSGGVAGGAVSALAEGGEKNLPLIRKLLKDTNPWIRAGAGFYLSLAEQGRQRAMPHSREVPPGDGLLARGGQTGDR